MPLRRMKLNNLSSGLTTYWPNIKHWLQGSQPHLTEMPKKRVSLGIGKIGIISVGCREHSYQLLPCPFPYLTCRRSFVEWYQWNAPSILISFLSGTGLCLAILSLHIHFLNHSLVGTKFKYYWSCLRVLHPFLWATAEQWCANMGSHTFFSFFFSTTEFCL